MRSQDGISTHVGEDWRDALSRESPTLLLPLTPGSTFPELFLGL